MPDYRPVHTDEVRPRIDDETRLVAEIAGRIAASQRTFDACSAVQSAYAILESTLAIQEQKLEQRIKEETRRRRGW